MLPSFPSLRERNLRTLYGDTKISDYTDNDKSPKGSVDVKIRSLVDLINIHPEYVTLSSCSGRVAMFDPAGSHHDDSAGSNTTDVEEEKTATEQGEGISKSKDKGTYISGKGRGKWIFVTHDILPDLGSQIIQSLQTVGQERLTLSTESANNNAPITFKHEPPLVHVGAASLEAGKKLLHIVKSICAMRESGLVVTDQRVTVELRTTGTLLCMPLMVQLTEGHSAFSLAPNEDYLMSLAEIANERMTQNEVLLKKLYANVREELFENQSSAYASASEVSNNEYKVTLRSLPPLNVWKTAAVAIPRYGTTNRDNDLDVIAFGGQGTGPKTKSPNGKAPTCRRWDQVFRLARRDGLWSDQWDTLPIDTTNSSAKTTLSTNAGKFGVQLASKLGSREGHRACILPQSTASSSETPDSNVIIMLFGGRTGGPNAPSNDMFLFMPRCVNSEDMGILGIPLDVRGTPPEPRFGHTMTPLSGSGRLNDGEPLAVITGGAGVLATTASTNVFGEMDDISHALPSIYILSRADDNESGESHFIWNRVPDMLSPRYYHTTFIDEQSNSLFVFGGLFRPDDPFNPDACAELDDDWTKKHNEMAINSWFTQPLFGEGAATEDQKAITYFDELPPIVGSSLATLSLKDTKLVLHVGGVKSSLLHTGAQEALSILTLQQNKNGSSELSRVQPSSISSVDAGQSEESSDYIIDFGSCIHHCLLMLPQGDTAESVLIGGGVPSFSFGQSYAR